MSNQTKRVVVVDDSDYSRARMVELVEGLGYKVAGTAASGDEGLALVQEKKPDLVLTDRDMPVPGSKIAWESRVPVIIVSADMDEITKHTLGDIGDHVIPLDKGDRGAIIAAIKKVLDSGNED